MEVLFQFRLEIPLDHRLGDSVGNRGNSQWPDSASSLLDVHALHRRREVTARRHPIPELVEIVCQVPFKLFDRLIVDSGCTPVRLYPLIGIPNQKLWNAPRLCFIQRAPPVADRKSTRLNSSHLGISYA